ncbi:MAG: insulinase family protein [Proteobacteria bacterium]|nr:insulinase family protein [Desulfobacterales bacterium]MBL7101370.1 insulinase family protein [Desulfobacteraceae bacterium]MBU0733064.1 insulinase family protein [Pseudomonadota bacterium]MBU0990249.1 insulinase family protein [Pseudomonadota bacterium]MBU1903020.1 insulinase family protein [Pseudomonadota bacterium]
MYRKTVLKNDVRIISERLEHLRSVSLGIWVNTGSRDEIRSENGVSHFIEHMSFKGTRNRSGFQIAKDLDSIGGLSNAFTSKENTCFHGRVLGKHFGLLADILSDIFLNPTFDPVDMEREREVIFQEINMMEDTPDDNLHTFFNLLFWPDHPLGRSTLGTGETVSAINKDTILEYIEKSYVPAEILVVAAGDVDHHEMVSYFEPLFESALERVRFSPGRDVPVSSGGVSIHFRELEQVHICLGGEAPSQMDERRFACAIFNTILGGNMSSRLFQEIRENRGLAYSVYSFLSTYVDAGLLGVYAATEKKNLNRMLETIRYEIMKLCEGELTESDVVAAKDHLVGNIYLGSEIADNRMMRIARNEFAFGRYIDYEELVSSLEQVSLDEVVEIAGSIFQDSKLSVAALGPLKEDDFDRSLIVYN